MRTALIAALAASALLASPAVADIDIALGNKDSVKGTLRAAETQTFRIRVPAGSKVSVVAKGKKTKTTSAPIVSFGVLDSGDTNLAAATLVEKGTGAKAKFVTTTSDELRILVAADGGAVGNFQLKASWKAPKKFGIDEAFGGEDTIQIPFAAEDGALVSGLVKAAKGSSATPRFASMGNGQFQVDFDPPAPGASSHKIKKERVDSGGTVTMVIQSDAAGAVTGKLTVKPPKTNRRKISLTADDVQPDDGEVDVVGTIIDEGGGELNIEDKEDDGLGGAGVLVPPGALDKPTVIVIGTSPNIPPQSEEQEGIGPTVFFGPDGLQFDDDVPVTITIPLDFDALPGGDTANVQVFTEDSKGKITLVPPPYSFNEEDGTMSFPASHFSSFRAFGPEVVGPLASTDVTGDGVDDLVIGSPQASIGGEIRVFAGRTADGNTGSSTSDIVLSGGASGEEWGGEVVLADINADGVQDILSRVEDGLFGTAHAFHGGAGLVSANRNAANVAYTGGAVGGNIGESIAVGDLNGDDVVDLAVGNEDTDTVHVFFGPLIGGDTAIAGAVFTGEAAGDLFGAEVQIGEVTGDAFPDLVVGADMIDTPGKTGSVYVFPGGLGFTGASAAAAPIEISGTGVDLGFGLDIGLGDVNGDGQGDIVTSRGADAPTANGKLYMFFGGAGLTSMNDTGADVIVTGLAASDQLGRPIVLADANGDAQLDVLFGVPGGNGGAGGFHFILGGASIVGAGGAPPPTLVAGQFAGDLFPQSIQVFAPEGTPGIALSAPGFDGGLNDIGRVYVFESLPSPDTGATQADSIITGELRDEQFGGDAND